MKYKGTKCYTTRISASSREKIYSKIDIRFAIENILHVDVSHVRDGDSLLYFADLIIEKEPDRQVLVEG